METVGIEPTSETGHMERATSVGRLDYSRADEGGRKTARTAPRPISVTLPEASEWADLLFGASFASEGVRQGDVPSRLGEGKSRNAECVLELRNEIGSCLVHA